MANKLQRLIPAVPAVPAVGGASPTVQLQVEKGSPATPDFAWELHGLGIRPTTTRLQILALLHREQGRWMRVGEVYSALLGQNGEEALPSIYRNLKDLERAGLVLRIWEEGSRGVHTVYQLRSDRATPAAFVLVCEGCNARFASADPVLSKALHMARQAASGESELPLTFRIACMNQHACAKAGRARDGMPGARKPQPMPV
ncbi:transcriptional repressor [Azohydromonas lata]|uniref:Transcriptional repressor n=1 Tax=Azohydromonas lata TaxID=45677 RepID=A0ABU5IE16_9BURK|nr:transcriptional repressor [Azohydromonas lata]MDZ5457360.1 transcriptional repressor [Azohydromonas lata]